MKIEDYIPQICITTTEEQFLEVYVDNNIFLNNLFAKIEKSQSKYDGVIVHMQKQRKYMLREEWPQKNCRICKL